ncbi:hypothetical protein GW17_00005768 [Ensete ventricosum]|nr:hypothetical protein GW17_00005768 [Ensete ventricosum]
MLPRPLPCRRASRHAWRTGGEACACRWGVPTLPVPDRLYDTWRPSYDRSSNYVGLATSAAQLSEGVMTWQSGRLPKIEMPGRRHLNDSTWDYLNDLTHTDKTKPC